MPTEEQVRRLAQLQDQQAAITQALEALLEGRFTGDADALDSWLVALNPTWAGQLSPRTPLYEWPPASEIPTPDIKWVGSPHFTYGHGGYSVCAIVIHTMAGSLAGSDSWFNNPNSHVSSHYGIGLGGEQHQYVALCNSSWANGILQAGNRWPCGGPPNYRTITIETEDRGLSGTPVTDAMYQATLEVARTALDTYPSIRYLLSHRVISPSSRAACCGERWWGRSQRFQQLAERLGLEAIW